MESIFQFSPTKSFSLLRHGNGKVFALRIRIADERMVATSKARVWHEKTIFLFTAIFLPYVRG